MGAEDKIMPVEETAATATDSGLSLNKADLFTTSGGEIPPKEFLGLASAPLAGCEDYASGETVVDYDPSLFQGPPTPPQAYSNDPPEIVEGLVASPKCGGDVEIDLDMLIRDEEPLGATPAPTSAVEQANGPMEVNIPIIYVSSSDGSAEKLGQELARSCQSLFSSRARMNSLICGNELQGPAVQGGKYSADVLAEQGIYNPAAFPAKPSIVVIHPSRSQSNAIPVLEHGIVRIGDSHSGDHFSELMSDDFLPPAASDSSRPQVQRGTRAKKSKPKSQQPGGVFHNNLQLPGPPQEEQQPEVSALAPLMTQSGSRLPPPAHLNELDRIRMCFDLPIQEAAKVLNVGVTVLKRKCRQYNIPRWPYRKLKSIQNLYESMESLEAQQGENGIDADNIRETKLKLFVERESMLWDPAISLNHETKKLRQSNFKYEYKVRQDRHSCSGTDSEADQLVRGAMAGEALSALPGGPAAALGTELAAWPQPLRTLSSESDASLRGQVAAYDEAQSSGGLPAKLPHPTL